MFSEWNREIENSARGINLQKAFHFLNIFLNFSMVSYCILLSFPAFRPLLNRVFSHFRQRKVSSSNSVYDWSVWLFSFLALASHKSNLDRLLVT